MANHAKRIYVEIEIAGSIETIWRHTQEPNLHQRWDLRFSEISYLPRPEISEPQRFTYATRIGFGLRIRGEGESVGTHDGPDGERTSALKFWSNDGKSLIREGSGYWKYARSANDPRVVRFYTAYDYDVRLGNVGILFDRAIFRPLMGWATAWSFDRLRLWIEQGINPAVSMRQSLCYMAARVAIAIVWLYQGIVPKLLLHDRGELAMIHAAGFSNSASSSMCVAIGWIEVAIGLVLLLGWRVRWPVWLTLFAMPAATIAVMIGTPELMTAPFNPFTLNLCVFALALIALLAVRDLPSASRCARRPAGSNQ